jgi:hypothetical protein
MAKLKPITIIRNETRLKAVFIRDIIMPKLLSGYTDFERDYSIPYHPALKLG